ncbi:MAG TPA: glycosyltransferase family 39 protein [Verrucomicrobiae bacterium]|jgi:4-amino-4-deoxy-L-arabinose transferase-like glycosyltransferase
MLDRVPAGGNVSLPMSQNDASCLPAPGRMSALFGRPLFLFLAILAVTMSLRAPLLDIPLDRDEGEYAYIGWRMDQHELPYRDWVDQKPPGAFWVYRLALALPMDPILAIHLMGALFAALSAGALFLLARRYLDDYWAAVAGLLLGVLSADPAVQGTAANTELFMQLPIILSQLALIRATASGARRRRYAILCGVLAGAAALFKQVGALDWLLLVVVFPMWCEKGQRLRKTLSFAAWSAAGAAAVWGSLMIYFVLNHAWNDFIYNILYHNLVYIHTLSPADRLAHFQDTVAKLFKSQALIWLFAAIGGGMWLKRGQKKRFAYVLLWMLSGAVGVNLSGYFYPHYFHVLLPPLALAAAMGASALASAGAAEAAQGWFRRAALTGALALIPVMTLSPFLFSYTASEAVRRIYPNDPYAEMPSLARRLAEVTGPQDRVYIFGSEPELLFYARRISAARYVILPSLFGPYADSQEKQTAVSVEITKAHPAAAFYLPNGLFFTPHIEHYLTDWSFDYLHRNFQADRWLGRTGAGPFTICPAPKSAPAPTNMVGELLVRKAPL